MLPGGRTADEPKWEQDDGQEGEEVLPNLTADRAASNDNGIGRVPGDISTVDRNVVDPGTVGRYSCDQVAIGQRRVRARGGGDAVAMWAAGEVALGPASRWSAGGCSCNRALQPQAPAPARSLRDAPLVCFLKE